MSKKTSSFRAPSAKVRVRAKAIWNKLKRAYPEADCALRHANAWELLVSTILSAQCTDQRVNQVTPELFRRWPKPADLAAASPAAVEKVIHSTGFYHQKTISIIASARRISENFSGRVPQRMEELLTLRGVARKTANVVLGTAYGLQEGVVVDTHVKRLSVRMGLSRQEDPEKIERELMGLFPRRDWTLLGHVLIGHGRRICQARKPDCEHCPISRQCPRVGVVQ